MADTVRVLLVDVDPDYLDEAATVLEQTAPRVEVVTATSVEAGWEIVTAEAIDCIVSGHDSPALDGVAFLEDIRVDYPDLPFILFTGAGNEAVASNAISAGVTDYLQKSSDSTRLEELADRVQAVVSAARVEQQDDNVDRRLHELTEATDDVFWMFDADWEELLFVNSAYEDIWGREIADLEANAQDFLEGVHPEDRSRVKEAMQTLSGGDTVEIEYRVDERVDYQRWVWVEGVPLTDASGTVERVAGYVRDISDRKEREAELERKTRAMDAAPVGITITDPNQEDNPLIYANESFQQITGYSEEEISGRNCRFLQGEETDADAVAKLRSAIDAAEPVSVELINYRAHGEQFWNQVTVAPVRDESGTVTNFVGFQRDVSDRKEREQMLHQYETLVENMDDAVFMFDESGACTFVDDTTVDRTGISRDTFLGMSITALLDLDIFDAEPTTENYRDATEEMLAGERTEARVTLQITPDGEETQHRDVQLSRAESNDGELVGIVGVARDVTDHRRRKRELEARNQAMRTATDGIAILDESEEYVFVNQAHADIYGYESPEAFIGETWQMCYSGDELERFESAVMPTLADTGSWRGEATGERNDGESFPQELSLTRTEDGRIICVVRDITDRKRREEALREQKAKIEALHQVATNISMVESRAAVYEELVGAARDILEYDIVIADEAQGRVLVPQASSKDVDADQYFEETPIYADDNLAARAFRTGETSVIEDLRELDVTPADSEYRSALTVPIGEMGVFQTVSRTPGAYDESDQELVELLVAHAREALARLVEEEKLRSRTEELERKNARLDEFASLVSHDLRNPLNIAQGRLDLALEEVENEHLEKVDHAHDRMEELIADLYELTRHGEEVTDPEPVEVADVVRACWSTVETNEATLELDLDTSRRVEADQSRFQQLLENLVGNAIEHGGSDVTVTVGSIVDGFYVEDDGSGIPEGDRESVLEYGVSGSESGSGLGLAIVVQIAEVHGWTVDVTESEAGGARFEFHGVEWQT